MMQHGTVGGYTGQGCRCQPCTAANSAYQAEYRKRRYLKQVGRFPVSKILPTLQRYRDAGYTARQISDASGVSQRHISWMLDPRHVDAMITWRTANGVMSAGPKLIQTEQKFVPSKLPRQQLRSMMALGWPMGWITEQLGMPYYALPTHSTYDTVRSEKARAIQELYDRVGNTEGPSSQVRALMRTRGHHPPAAYDEEGNLIEDAVIKKRRGKNRAVPRKRAARSRRAA